jgi:hypothetical protein
MELNNKNPNDPHKPCKFFKQGKGHCKHGDNCRFSHDIHTQKSNHNHSNHKPNKHPRRKKKNTESFTPDYSPPDMRVIIHSSPHKQLQPLTRNDVIILPNFFNQIKDEIIPPQFQTQTPHQTQSQSRSRSPILDSLINEMNNTGYTKDQLWKSWHGDSHLIADDKLDKGAWKQHTPTFNNIIAKIQEFFNMEVKATRFNLYPSNADWKPYHRDAAAIDPKKAKTQNITVAATFGVTRTASFQHFTTKTRVDFPLEDSSIYVFNKQVNVDWMHGITPIKEDSNNKATTNTPITTSEEKGVNGGNSPIIKGVNGGNSPVRVSIICWGYTNQLE